MIKKGFSYLLPFIKGENIGKIKGKHLLLGLIFVLSLTFFLHYREVRVAHLEINSISQKGVWAPISFSFSDIEATRVLRQEAIRDIGIVRRLDTKQILKIDKEIEHDLRVYPTWRDKISKATFEDLYICKEAVREGLRKIYFVNERTFQKMKELDISTEGFLIFNPENTEETTVLPAPVWKEICTLAFPKFLYSDPVYEYISELFQQKMWIFKEDLGAQNRIRQEVKANSPHRKTPVEMGMAVIEAGEKVTQRHIDMMREMKRVLMEKDNELTPLAISGSFFMALIFTALIIIYLCMQKLEILTSFRKLALLATIIILSLIFAKVTEFVILNKTGSLVDVFCYPIVILFGALLTCLLLDVQTSFIVSVFLSIILGITLAVKHDYFLVMNLGASLVGIVAVRKIRRRKEIFEVCAQVWLAVIPIIIAFNFFENHFWTAQLIKELFAAFVFISVTAVMVVGLLPILEASFDVVTGMTLTEYIDPNHPLLRRLSIEAAGTYQHSCVVGSIAADAALAIGANGLFCRAVALFHDIGKLTRPEYFTENQTDGVNPHRAITPLESLQVIKAHVADGVALATQHGLPQGLIDVIEEHHGTSVIYWFYRMQVALLGNENLVDIAEFRYSGSKPRSKESAIIMICDCAEAAFSSLDAVNESILDSMIKKIIEKKVQDGQLDECKLTFEELSIIKKTILKTLLVISHNRLKYPEKTPDPALV